MYLYGEIGPCPTTGGPTQDSRLDVPERGPHDSRFKVRIVIFGITIRGWEFLTPRIKDKDCVRGQANIPNFYPSMLSEYPKMIIYQNGSCVLLFFKLVKRFAWERFRNWISSGEYIFWGLLVCTLMFFLTSKESWELNKLDATFSRKTLS